MLPQEIRHAWLYIHPIARLVDCLLGMYAAMLFMAIRDNASYVRKIDKHIQLIDAVVVLMFIGVIFESIYRYQLGFAQLYHTIFWIPELLLILFVALRSLSKEQSLIQSLLNCRVIECIGACSLSFYILHIPMMTALSKIYPACAPNAKSFTGGGDCAVRDNHGQQNILSVNRNTLNKILE